MIKAIIKILRIDKDELTLVKGRSKVTLNKWGLEPMRVYGQLEII